MAYDKRLTKEIEMSEQKQLTAQDLELMFHRGTNHLAGITTDLVNAYNALLAEYNKVKAELDELKAK